MSSAGTVTVDIVADTTKLDKALRDTEKKAADAGKAIDSKLTPSVKSADKALSGMGQSSDGASRATDSVSRAADRASVSLKKSKDALDQAGAAAHRSVDGFGALNSVVGRLPGPIGASIGQLSALGSTALSIGGPLAVAAGALALVSHQAERVVQLDALRQSVNLTTQEMAALEVVAGRSDTTAEHLVRTLNTLTINLAQATDQTSAEAQALKSIGVSIDTLKGKNPAQAFAEIAEGLKNTTDSTAKAQAGMALFGTQYSRLSQVLSEGKAGFTDAAKAADSLGLSLSSDKLEAARKADAAFDDLSLALTGLTRSISLLAASPLADVVKQLTELVTTVGGIPVEIVDSLNDIAQALDKLMGTGKFAAGGSGWVSKVTPTDADTASLRQFGADLDKTAQAAKFAEAVLDKTFVDFTSKLLRVQEGKTKAEADAIATQMAWAKLAQEQYPAVLAALTSIGKAVKSAFTPPVEQFPGGQGPQGPNNMESVKAGEVDALFSELKKADAALKELRATAGEVLGPVAPGVMTEAKIYADIWEKALEERNSAAKKANEAFLELNADLGKQLAQQGMDRTQISLDEENRRFAEQMKIIEEERLLSAENQAAADQAELAARQIHEANKTEIVRASSQERADKEIQMGVMVAQQIGSALGSFASMLDQNNKKEFESAKALRYAEAIINTAAGVTNALATPGVPPPLAIAQSIAIAAAGAAQIAAIARTKFKGGGSPGGAPSASGVSGQGNGPPSTGDPQKAGPTPVNLTLYGQSFSDQTLRAFVGSLNQVAGDNVNIKVN